MLRAVGLLLIGIARLLPVNSNVLGALPRFILSSSCHRYPQHHTSSFPSHPGMRQSQTPHPHHLVLQLPLRLGFLEAIWGGPPTNKTLKGLVLFLCGCVPCICLVCPSVSARVCFYLPPFLPSLPPFPSSFHPSLPSSLPCARALCVGDRSRSRAGELV